MASKKRLIDKTPAIMVILLCGLMFVSNIISSALQVLFRRKKPHIWFFPVSNVVYACLLCPVLHSNFFWGVRTSMPTHTTLNKRRRPKLVVTEQLFGYLFRVTVVAVIPSACSLGPVRGGLWFWFRAHLLQFFKHSFSLCTLMRKGRTRHYCTRLQTAAAWSSLAPSSNTYMRTYM